ncbi:hypothetical protein PHG31p228 [Aeromonas phage 31]|uniref:Uncharacterized protein PHG31ORF231c n=1 Tax=Aeromonas phage 31 TaxID=321023 RepID=Q56ED3_9CAUD|nr:hypothetical protein PHG31p228 [Aeromonas phage 31]AAX63717.1 hypothetical protein PHG31p228 [Aeromonas phage 31]APU01121.1 hypothetical protein [Aeromonas phage 31.2]
MFELYGDVKDFKLFKFKSPEHFVEWLRIKPDVENYYGDMDPEQPFVGSMTIWYCHEEAIFDICDYSGRPPEDDCPTVAFTQDQINEFLDLVSDNPEEECEECRLRLIEDKLIRIEKLQKEIEFLKKQLN